MNKGFIAPVIAPEEYIFGGLRAPKIIINPGGQWDDFVPTIEHQKKNTETYNCTAFGTLNAIETLLNRQYGVQKNYSDRALGIMAGTKPPGNSPQTVAEVARKQGLLEEVYLPFDNDVTTPEAYFSPNPLPTHLEKKAKQWLAVYELYHEWVFTPFFKPEEKPSILMESLAYSPVGVSVDAWHQGSDGKYIKKGQDNHWTVIIGYKEGEYWKCYDSYDDAVKHLAWDYNFDFGKSYRVVRKEAGSQGWFTRFMMKFCK